MGNAVSAAALLAAGTAVGASVGWAISPLPQSNKAVGAIEGGTLGVLLTSFAGLLSPFYAPQWKRLGQTAGLIGVGAVATMAAIGAARTAQAGVPPSRQLPAPTAAVSLLPGSVYEFAATVPQGATVDSLTAQLSAAGWGGASVLFFGPTSSSAIVPAEMAPLMIAAAMNTPTVYIARGTWNGASQPIPAGVVALRVG